MTWEAMGPISVSGCIKTDTPSSAEGPCVSTGIAFGGGKGGCLGVVAGDVVIGGNFVGGGKIGLDGGGEAAFVSLIVGIAL